MMNDATLAVPEELTCATADPIGCVSEMLFRRAQAAGVTEIEIELAGDDGWFSVALDHAFAPDCLLPALLAPMRQAYEHAWMDRVGFAFPIRTEPDSEAAMSVRAVWDESGSPGSLVALCALDALSGLLPAGAGDGVLHIPVAAG